MDINNARNDEIENDSSSVSAGNHSPKDVFTQDIRNIIIELLKKGAISSFDNEKSFKTLYLNREKIGDYLENINLKLVINQENCIAYIENYHRENDNDEENSLSSETSNPDDDNFLISSRKLNVFDTLILLILRKFYQERYTSGENTIVIDMDRIENMLVPYNGIVGSAKANRKKIRGILDRFAERKLLKFLTSEDNDRLVISPLIRYVVDADMLKKMLDEYLCLAKKHKITLPNNMLGEDEDNDADQANSEDEEL